MLTPQDVADALNAAGIDDRTKLDAFFGFAGGLVRRSQLLAQIDRLREERAATNQATEGQIQGLTQQVGAIDAMLRGQ